MLPADFFPQVGAFYGTGLPGLAGQAIRIGQAIIGDWSQITHAGMYVGLVNGVPSCVEAQGSGVCVVPLAEVMARTPLVWEIDPIAPGAGTLMAAAALGDVGDAYGWLTYAEFVADEFGLKAPRLRAVVARSTHTICSQGVMRWKLAGGVQLVTPDKAPGSTSPGDLANAGTIWHARTGPYLTPPQRTETP